MSNNSELVKEKVSQFIVSHAGLSDLDRDVDIFEAGLVDSLFAITLMEFIEKNFNIQIVTEDLNISNFKSVNAISAFIDNKVSAAEALNV